MVESKNIAENATELAALRGALEALAELEQNTRQSIARQRAHERIELRAAVFVRPGNSSERHRLVVEGLTADVSAGGCLLLLSRPLPPGDIFWLTFDEAQLALAPRLARCVRCRMVDESTFETSLQFFHEVDLAAAIPRGASPQS